MAEQEKALLSRFGRLGHVEGVGSFKKQETTINGRTVRHLDTSHGRYTAVHSGKGQHVLLYSRHDSTRPIALIRKPVDRRKVHALVTAHHYRIAGVEHAAWFRGKEKWDAHTDHRMKGDYVSNKTPTTLKEKHEHLQEHLNDMASRSGPDQHHSQQMLKHLPAFNAPAHAWRAYDNRHAQHSKIGGLRWQVGDILRHHDEIERVKTA